jgi:hypothetical protein
MPAFVSLATVVNEPLVHRSVDDAVELGTPTACIARMSGQRRVRVHQTAVAPR